MLQIAPRFSGETCPKLQGKASPPNKEQRQGYVSRSGCLAAASVWSAAFASRHLPSQGRLSVFGKPCTRPDEPANAPLEGARRWLGRLCRSEAQSPRGGHPEPSLEGILSYCGLATLRPPCLSEQSVGRRVEAPAQHISCASAFTASLSDINAEAPVCGAPAPCVVIEVCGFGRLN